MPGFAFAVKYNTTRGHLDFNVINTDFGTVAMDTREGIDAQTMESLHNLSSITSYMALRPGYFISSTGNSIHYELHFRSAPSYIEVLDIYGCGLRWTSDANGGDASSVSVVVIVASSCSLVALVLFLGAVCLFCGRRQVKRESDVATRAYGL